MVAGACCLWGPLLAASLRAARCMQALLSCLSPGNSGTPCEHRRASRAGPAYSKHTNTFIPSPRSHACRCARVRCRHIDDNKLCCDALLVRSMAAASRRRHGSACDALLSGMCLAACLLACISRASSRRSMRASTACASLCCVLQAACHLAAILPAPTSSPCRHFTSGSSTPRIRATRASHVSTSARAHVVPLCRSCGRG